MSLTFRCQAPKEIYTEQYPLQRPVMSERYRGLLRLNVNPETGETLCIACNLCALACPEKLIKVESERDPETKKKVLTGWTWNASRCMFCGLCEDACPTDCVELSQDFEFATYSRDFVIERAQLEKGYEPTVYKK
jgi:NADH-quinone oxidoreductase subunit I